MIAIAIRFMKAVLRKGLVILALSMMIADLCVGQSDTVWVETLTFNDITKRRGTWNFPDSDETYRKILMYYTLKCDSRTTADRWACGEWDYLTHTTFHQHTGQFDSTLTEHPYFKVGADAPDSIAYTSVPTHTTYERYKYKLTVDSVISETSYQIGDGTGEVETTTGSHRIQFLVTRQNFIDAGAPLSVEINAVRLYVKEKGGLLRDFTIRMQRLPRNTSKLDQFYNADLITLFQDDVQFADTGWHTLYFQESFSWLSLFALAVDVSYQADAGSDPVIWLAHDGGSGVEAFATDPDGYLLFDGDHDYVDMGNVPELSGAEQATFETWVRLDKTEKQNKLLGLGNNFHIETGSQNALYCIVRHPGDNTHGSATGVLGTGEWAHVAMVFDGRKDTNEDRLKLYVNGERVTLTFRGNIPATSTVSDDPFTLSGLFHGTSALPGALDEARAWSVALEESVIQEWINKPLDSTHPNYGSLLGYYPLDELEGTTVQDHSDNNRDGIMIGTPAWEDRNSVDLNFNSNSLSEQPNIIFVNGTYKTRLDSTLLSDRVKDPPISIAIYEIQGHKPVIKEVFYGWRSGYEYTYGPDGSVVDSSAVPAETVMQNRTLEYYDEPEEIIEKFEIGRFITPYGINLDLGPDGFTWIYDVTDYAPLLRGDVDLSAGNNQELIDLRFAFIKGTPSRDVLSIDRVWGPRRSYKYRDLSDDTKLQKTTLSLLPEAKQFKVRTVITGHGHRSNDGSYPHCCEWRDNTHYLTVDDAKTFEWRVWQTFDCALNPVYPQGGTWPGAREGWCPGDLVKANDFEITDLIAGDEVTLDYSITPVPSDNLDMGDGNYQMSFHLFQYGGPYYTLDAEVYDVLAPNNFPGYSRSNPICADPIVVVRNNSTVPLTSLDFSYEVSGGTTEAYTWKGSVEPHKMAEVVLPVPGEEFWIGDESNEFTVRISNPNSEIDQYAENNLHTSRFNMPDLYSEKLVLWYKTNLRAPEFSLQIKNIEGNVVYSKENATNNTLYKDELNLSPGCYTLELTDPRNLGLSYWAVPEQGSGYIRLHNEDGDVRKAFESDFGHKITYSFTLGGTTHVQEENFDELVSLIPNPAEGHVTLQMKGYELGQSEIRMYDIEGALIYSDEAYIGSDFNLLIDTRELTPGTYFITITNDRYKLSKQFVKK